MSSRDELHDRFETKDMRAANLGVNEAVKIEQILRRAKEIRRERGGVFGYDFEDWLQAWNELPREGYGVNSADGSGGLAIHPASR
jgi:hypothetical protein